MNSRSGLPTILLGALCALGSVASLGWLPALCALPAGVYLLGHGLAAPWILRATSGPAERGKLWLFALALSPVTALAIALSARVVLPDGERGAQAAQAAWMLVGGLLLFVQPRREVEQQPASRARWLIRGLALAGLGVVAWLTLRGSAVRVSHHGLLHAGLSLATDRSIPPSNPWMAGEPLGYYWVWHALVALVARALSLPVTFAAALLSIWSMFVTVLATGLCAATCLRAGAREVIAVLLGLFGLGVVGGLGWLWGGAGFEAPTDALGLLGTLRESLIPRVSGQLLFDPRLAFGLSKFLNVSSYPTSFALAACGLAAGAHALRHGQRPWPLLTAICLGASFVFNPLIGAPALAAVGCAALFFPGVPRVRWDLPLLLGLAALPGAFSVLEARAAFVGEAVRFGFSTQDLLGTLVPLAPLWVAACLGLWPGAGRDQGDSEVRRDLRPARAMLWFGAVGASGLGVMAQLPYANEYKFVRFALLPLAILASAGLATGYRRGVLGRSIALVLGLVITTGGLASATLGLRAYAAMARVDLPLIELADRLTPIPAAAPEWKSESTHRAALFEFLRTDPRIREANPVLWMSTLEDESFLTQARYARKRLDGEPIGALHAFSDEFNLQAHEAPAFAGLDLYLDRPSQVLGGEGERFVHRVERLNSVFFQLKNQWGTSERAAFEELGRPVLVFAGELERSVRKDLVAHLEQFGLLEIYSSGGARLYAWPPEFADRFASTGEQSSEEAKN